MPLLYHIIYPILIFIAWIVRPWGRWQVRGKENVPRKGPLIVVSNHINLNDVPLLAVSLGRKAAFVAKEELFRSKLKRFLMYKLGAFPVHKGRRDIATIRRAQKRLAEGGVVILFPEGSRSRNAKLQPAFSGSALIALRSGAPILPVGISGTEKLKNVASAFRRPKVTISFGKPLSLSTINSDANKRLTKEKRSELTHLLMQRIAELLPPEYQGNYDSNESGQHEN